MDVNEDRSENLNDNNEDRFSFQFVSRKKSIMDTISTDNANKTFSMPFLDILWQDTEYKHISVVKTDQRI